MTDQFQTIVVGGGALGSATAYWLTRSGQTDVLLLERYGLGHAHGSSGDHSRVIRRSYHDTVYGRMTAAMYENWRQLDELAGQRIFIKTGGLDIAIEGTPGADAVENYRRVMTETGVPFEKLDKAGLLERFPQWSIDADAVRASYQPDSGIIDIRRAVLTHIALAEAQGATVRENCTVRSLEPFDGGVSVITDDATYTADKVVVCAGSWTDELLRPLGQTWTTTVTEEQVVYIRTPHIAEFAVGKFPIWGFYGDDLTYGFPTYGEVAIKVARENLRRAVTQAERNPEPNESETAWLLDFVARYLPRGSGPVLYGRTCPYDLPPDRNFILDNLPGQPNIIVGVGAAHAGKFSGLIGEILAELAVTGRSSHPIEPFRADRPQLVDPTYIPVFDLKH